MSREILRTGFATRVKYGGAAYSLTAYPEPAPSDGSVMLELRARGEYQISLSANDARVLARMLVTLAEEIEKPEGKR